MPTGSYSLTAKATDSKSVVTTSAIVQVFVEATINPIVTRRKINIDNRNNSKKFSRGSLNLKVPVIANTGAIRKSIHTTTNQSFTSDNDKHSMTVQINPSAIRVPSCDEPPGVLVPPIAPDDILPVAAGNAENILSIESNFQKPKVYPNPVEKAFNIEFPATYKGNISLQIADPVGKIYDLGKFRLSSAEFKTFKVNVSNLFLRSGIYFLRIHSDIRKTEVIKLIVQ